MNYYRVLSGFSADDPGDENGIAHQSSTAFGTEVPSIDKAFDPIIMITDKKDGFGAEESRQLNKQQLSRLLTVFQQPLSSL